MRDIPTASEPAAVEAGLATLLDRPVTAADRARALLHLRDWTGCALAGAARPAGRGLARWASAQGHAGRASALGHGPAGAETAAFVNGGLGNILEMDDLHRASILHAGDVVVPAALAVAEEAGASGPALLDALVRGYEAAIRIGSAAARGGYALWYNSGTCGVFGAAAAAAAARGLRAAQLLDALGHAGMMAAGLWQCRIGRNDGKQIATAHAARAGVSAAALAAEGLRGPHGILSGELGFLRGFYPQADPAGLLAAPDDPWRVHEVSFKPWPACRHTHAAIAAALRLRDRVTPVRIASIEVQSHAAGVAFCDTPDPQDDHGARFSFQHCVAVTLLHGAPGLAAFAAPARTDPAVRALRDRIFVCEASDLSDAFPGRHGARLRVVCRDGTELTETVANAPGDPEDPLGDGQLHAKFRANAAAAGLDDDIATALEDALDALPHAAEPAALSAALRAASAMIATARPEPAHA